MTQPVDPEELSLVGDLLVGPPRPQRSGQEVYSRVPATKLPDPLRDWLGRLAGFKSEHSLTGKTRAEVSSRLRRYERRRRVCIAASG